MAKIVNISPTPNENAMRFELNGTLTSGTPYSFENKEEAQKDELATNLFSIKGVTNVYNLMNFLSLRQNL